MYTEVQLFMPAVFQPVLFIASPIKIFAETVRLFQP